MERCTKDAVEGKTISGVMVATIIMSSSLASRFASDRALLAASVAKNAVVSSSVVTCRVLIPVRVVIHSSEVSTNFDMSWFVSILAGAKAPLPVITAR